MTPELEKYYTDRFDMMSSKGWKELIEDVEELKKSYENLSSVKTVDDLYFKKGQLDIIHWLINLKEVSEEAFEGLKLEETV